VSGFAAPDGRIFRPALEQIVPYEPGKPVEEVQRELGLDRVVKLASNEGPYGPFPAAHAAMERALPELNRYPDGGAYALRAALAERLGVRYEELALGAGSDGLVDGLSQALLDPGDEVVMGWPSFPSYAIYATKLGGRPVQVPLTADYRYDIAALFAAVTERTKIVYVCHPNNPTGTMNTRAELDALFAQVPEHVLVVLDQAYFEYIDDPDYADGLDYVRAGHRVLVLRTFSKIYGLAGLRIGYGVAHEDVVRALSKTRRAFDLVTPAQIGALASLGDAAELERRRRANAEAIPELERILRAHGLDPVPSVANFVFADLGEDARPLFEALLREGVIVRPTAGFGAPNAIRVTAGLRDEHELLDGALGRVLARAKN
jgi:histidinol-phosphate aminotransferase